MRSYDVFFYGSLAFALGVAAASAGFPLFESTAVSLAIFGLCLGLWAWGSGRRVLWFSALSFLTVLGCAYYRADDLRFRSAPVPFGSVSTFRGEVIGYPERRENRTNLTVRMNGLNGARLFVTVPTEPEFAYGDTVAFRGKILEPTGTWGKTLEKDRIRGTVSFPKTELVSRGGGSPILAFLYRVRNAVIRGTYRSLPAREAALASGLVVGDTSGFSAEFRESMKASGTTHLTALSGYNIMVVVGIVGAVLASVFNRRVTFVLIALTLLGFVSATGAEASAVRAAVMASVLLLAGQVGRSYDPRNAIAFAGISMILVNPKVLAFDLGFELSFLALVGITYVRPAILGWLRVRSGSESLLSWREALTASVSAQLAVLPILSSQLGYFSVLSFIPNVLLAPVVPLAMGLGFASSIAGWVSLFVGGAVGWLTYPVLHAVAWVIEVAGRYPLNISYAVSVPVATVYYVLLARFTVLGLRRSKLIEREA